ncbi:hypothetical protein CRG98_005686 [Punica granatum]|uniref:Uncharacterized protein n=1 Tax=Punica granatum TaxID=22663 RepID=A0A2I0KZP7_PUNGR|nr:hypothetical protein CRG98_005686 [Punica granatum]
MVMNGALWYGLYVLQGKASTSTTFERLTLEEKYLGDLGLDKCKRGSRGHVEKLVEKVEFVVENLETLETKPMVVDDVQMGRSEERQHSLRNNSQTRDRQREHLRPRDCFELAELVVSSNAEVEDMTCRRVSFGACTKRKLRKPGTPKESKGGLDWNGTHAR